MKIFEFNWVLSNLSIVWNSHEAIRFGPDLCTIEINGYELPSVLADANSFGQHFWVGSSHQYLVFDLSGKSLIIERFKKGYCVLDHKRSGNIEWIKCEKDEMLQYKASLHREVEYWNLSSENWLSYS